MSLTTSGAGLTLNCDDRRTYGGVKTIYLADMADIDTLTASASPAYDYSAITFTATDKFEKFEFSRYQAEFRQNLQRADNGSISNTVEVELSIPRGDSGKLASVQDLVEACKMVAVVYLYSGDAFVIGYDEKFQKDAYMELVTDAATSGKAISDANQHVITLRAMHGELCREFSGTEGDLTV